jgi:hypothetical protein
MKKRWRNPAQISNRPKGVLKLFHYYDYVNLYGTRMFAIAGMDAMPRNYNQILFTGTMQECMLRMNPPGLEGSVEDIKRQIRVASLI